MSSTIAVAPRYLSLSQDDNYITLTTDLVSSDFPLTRLNCGDTAAPVAGNTFTLHWETSELVFTFATAPDRSGTELPLRAGGETADEYRARLVEAFRESELLARYWRVVDSVSNQVIRFQYKVSQPLTITSTCNATGMAAVIEEPGSYPTSEENLRGVVHVFTTDNDDDPVVVLEGDYQTSSPYQTTFNLANVAPVSAYLPPIATMAATVPGVNNYAVVQATEAFKNMYIRHADKYGTPPVAEALKRATAFNVIYGGSAGSSRRVFGSNSGRWLCHAYYDENGTRYNRPILDGQPDYVFLWNGANTITVAVRVKVTYTDGTSDTIAVPGTTTFALAAAKLYCFPSGPAQLGIDTAPGATTKTIHGYEFRITDPTGAAVLFRVPFVMEYCPQWEVLLAYSNGLGGIETIPFTGKTNYIYEAERQVFERVNSPALSVADGTNIAYDVQGLQSWQATTTNLPRAYADHLRQMLVGETWLIDRKNMRWLRVLVSDTSANHKDDEELYSITITFKLATKDNQYHRL